MQPNYSPCPACGSMQPQTGQTCTQCGCPLPQGYSVPAGYSVPPQPSQPPMQGMAQPVQQPLPAGQPQAGYGQPAAPYPAQPEGAYGAPMWPAPPPKKKSKAPLIIILCAVAVVLVGGGLAFFFLFGGSSGGSGSQPDTAQADYDALAAGICEQTTPGRIGAYAGELDVFETEHPDVKMDRDLLSLVNACAEYADGDVDDEGRYTGAIRALERLEGADDRDVAACAAAALDAVRDEYDEFLAYYTDPTPPDPDPVSPSSSSEPDPVPSSPSSDAGMPSENPFDDPPYDVGEMDFAALEIIEGDLYYTFTFTNTSDKTMVFAEALVFCYDEYGNPVYDEYGDNWDWGWTYDVVIGPGYSYDLTDYLMYLSADDVAYIFPVITYVEFEDGSEWGFFSKDTDEDTLYDYYDDLNGEVDELIGILLD